MGEELNKGNGKLNGSINTETTAGSGQTAGNPGTAANTGTGPAAGTVTTGSAGTTAGAKEEKKFSGLPPVENEAPAPEKPKKKATRKTSRKKKQPEVSYNASQLTALIMSGSMIIASRENMSMFSLSEDEAMQLATPIANMIEKNEKLKNMGEYADALALVTAALLIFIPRFILYSDVKKKEKLRKNGGVRLVRETEKVKRDNSGNDGKPADIDKTNDQGFRGVLPVYDGI